jgi:hypothetical protein
MDIEEPVQLVNDQEQEQDGQHLNRYFKPAIFDPDRVYHKG